jgi:methyltransferase (TIGR00027 family)
MRSRSTTFFSHAFDQQGKRTMTASRTARYVALYRALESAERQREPLFDDPYARTFLPCSLRLAAYAAHMPGVRSILLRHPRSRADDNAPGARTSAIARTRFIDDQVRAAVAAGIDQLVVLGDGYDCRALRLRELQHCHVFEVDRPDTQVEKQAAQARAGVAAHERVRYIGFDLQTGDDLLEALGSAGFDASRRCLFIWEGVTHYLDAATVERMFAWIGRAAAGSRCVFTYVHRGLLDGSVTFDASAKPLRAVRRLGERDADAFGLDPRELPAFLSKFRLVLEADLAADTYRKRHLGEHANELHGYGFYRLATVHVIGN